MPESTGSQASGGNASTRAAVASKWASAASAVIQKQQGQSGVRVEVQPSTSISDSFASRMQDSACYISLLLRKNVTLWQALATLS
jgi:hypothetical protein